MTHNDINYRELLAFGWEKTKEHYWFLLSLFIINLILGAATSHFAALNAIVSVLMTIAVVSVLLEIASGHTPVYKDLLKPFRSYKITLHYFLGLLLIGLTIGVGALLLLIPLLLGSLAATIIAGVLLALAAIYALIRLQFFRYIVIEHEHVGPIQAFRTSYTMTHGKFWQLLGFLFAIIVLNILGALLVLVGLLVTVPVTLLAYTHLYKKLSHSHSS
jgi:uncharacterized membrane protein